MIVLGIESSCDETAAAIVSDKREILGESLLSQEEHKAFGGVVPEIAARSHLEHIDEIIELCVKRAGIKLEDVDAIAASSGPGLIGGVVVGVMAATASANADYAYSGWLFGYLHLSNALYEADPALAAASYQTLCAEARADLAANNAYWKQWEGPVKQTGEKVYTTFLQGYGQDLGMRSYGACVDLLVEEFLTNTTSCD